MRTLREPASTRFPSTPPAAKRARQRQDEILLPVIRAGGARIETPVAGIDHHQRPTIVAPPCDIGQRDVGSRLAQGQPCLGGRSVGGRSGHRAQEREARQNGRRQREDQGEDRTVCHGPSAPRVKRRPSAIWLPRHTHGASGHALGQQAGGFPVPARSHSTAKAALAAAFARRQVDAEHSRPPFEDAGPDSGPRGALGGRCAWGAPGGFCRHGIFA